MVEEKEGNHFSLVGLLHQGGRPFLSRMYTTATKVRELANYRQIFAQIAIGGMPFLSVGMVSAF